MQNAIVTLIVLCSFAYAAWALMPSKTRRGLAELLMRLPLPGFVASRLQWAARRSNACGCDGCDQAVPKKGAATDAKTIKIHRVKSTLKA